MKGLLIAVEGVNGSGKSTIIHKLQAHFHDIGREVRVYKFPDRQGYKGPEIDAFLKGRNPFKHIYDIFAAFAANKQAAQAQIRADLSRGVLVICDRYIASGIVYHIPMAASDHSVENYRKVLGHFDKDLLIPDITYLISGYYLHLRNEQKQLYHYEHAQATQLFETFKKIVPKCSTKHRIVINNDLRQTVVYIANDILQRAQVQ